VPHGGPIKLFIIADNSFKNFRPLLCKRFISVFSEYYFSAENLKNDTFLRHCMDLQGWVPVEVVCEFKRMKQLNIDEEAAIQVIATALLSDYCIFSQMSIITDTLIAHC